MTEAEPVLTAPGWYAYHDDRDTFESMQPDVQYFDDASRPTPSHRVQPDARIAGAAHDGQLQIASDLALARTAAERTRLVNGMLSLIGFTDIAYLTLRVDAHEQIERVFFAREFSSDHWTPEYFTSARHRVDPRLHAVLTSRAPHLWDLQTLAQACRRTGSTQLRALVDESRARGAGCGLMFCVPVAQTRLRSIISFTSPVQQAAWIGDAVIAQTLALGLSLHQHCSPVVRALERNATEASLSDAQRRILRFVAVGLSDKQIAQRMHTTPHNVDYHLRRLREKCSVKSRAQLAFLAGRLLGP